MEIEKLKKERDNHINKIFLFGFYIAFIFGIPAAGGVFLGRKLDMMYQTGNKITLLVLVGTFIFSWIFLLAQYNRLNETLKNMNRDIKKMTTPPGEKK